MPRQFLNRGDRLVFSNGIIILAALASALIAVFDAELNRLINLYLVGVFISFTLSQTGMVVRWRRRREPGWQRSLTINAFGACVTAIVLCVTVVTKFTDGAYIVVSAIPVLMFVMFQVHRHYVLLADQLTHPDRRPDHLRPGGRHMVILVTEINPAVARAVGYARSVRPTTLVGVTTDPESRVKWQSMCPEIELVTLADGPSTIARTKRYLRQRKAELPEEDFLTVLVPEVLESRSLLEVLRKPALHRLKASLVAEPDVHVMDVPVVKDDIAGQIEFVHEPARNHVVVMVSKVNNATLHAFRYAESLDPTDIRAVTFSLDAADSERLGEDWVAQRIPYALEIEDSPFRDIGPSLRRYIRGFRADGIDRVVTVLLPEFVTERRLHRILHGQTALFIKRHMLFEPGVIVVSVPYHLEKPLGERQRQR
jgi:hypothetical protein